MTSRIFWSEVVSGNATAIQEEVTTRFADYSHRFLAFYSEYQPLCCLFCLISFSLTGKVAVGDCVHACQTSFHCGFHGSLREQRGVCGGCVWLHGSHAFAKHNILQSRTTRLVIPNTPQYTFIAVPHVSPYPGTRTTSRLQALVPLCTTLDASWEGWDWPHCGMLMS